MIYTIKSKDGTQAVYTKENSEQVFIRDIDGDNKEYILFRAESLKVVNEIWRATGGADGDFEVVSEK